MAKKKDEGEEKVVKSNALKAAMRHAETKNGVKGEYVSERVKEAVIGIPLPCLSLMYLLDSNVLPISKIIKIAGATMSNKSSLGFEILRWVMAHNGYGHYVENEGAKWSPSLFKSIAGADNLRKLAVDISTDGSNAMENISSSLKFVEKEKIKDQLVGILLDSLTGSDTEASMTKTIMTDGAATRAFPELAMLWTRYFQSLAPQLVGWPIVFVFINHLKEMADQKTGIVKKKSPGGVAQDFYSALIFNVTRIDKDTRAKREVNGESVTLPHEVRRLKIQCVKSSLGTENRDIATDFIWYFDENNEQVSFFDWDASTAYLLAAEQGTWGNRYKRQEGESIYAKLEDILDVRVDRNLYSSKRLGIVNKAANTFGQAVHTNAELMEELIYFFHIKQHPVWSGVLPEAEAVQEALGEPPPAQVETKVTKKKQKKEDGEDRFDTGAK